MEMLQIPYERKKISPIEKRTNNVEALSNEEREQLRQELKVMKKGGSDFHFSRINVNELSEEELGLYKKYKEGKLTDEDVSEFNVRNPAFSPEFNFAGVLRSRIAAKKEEEFNNEKEKLEDAAKQKLEEIKTVNPAAEEYLKKLKLDMLRRSDYKAIINISTLDLLDYESKLKEYFRNQRPKDEKKENILKLDPVTINNSDIYKCYAMLCHIKEHKPFDPETLANSL